MKRKIVYILVLIILGIAILWSLNSQQSNTKPSVDSSTSSSTGPSRKESRDIAEFFMLEFVLDEVDFEKAQAYGLAEGKQKLKKEYFELQTLYRNLVCDYINQHIDFTDFDQEISQLEVSKYFKLVQKPLDQFSRLEEYYSSVSSLDSQYLYLRNQIFIERLSKDEFQTLKDIKAGKIQDDQQKKSLVQASMQKVLKYYKDIDNPEAVVQYRDHGGGAIEAMTHHTAVLFSIEYRQPSNFEDIPYFSDAQTPKRREELLKYDALVPKYEEIFSKELGVTVQIENSLYSTIRQT